MAVGLRQRPNKTPLSSLSKNNNKTEASASNSSQQTLNEEHSLENPIIHNLGLHNNLASCTKLKSAEMMVNDKLSSPSSSANSYPRDGASVGNSSGGTSQSNADEPCLVIKTQPPSYVYSNESFKVEVQLELPKVSSPPSTIWNVDDAVNLKATLCYAKTGKPVKDEATLMTTPMAITIPGVPSADSSSSANDNNTSGKRSAVVECMIRTDSIRRDGESGYVVRFSTTGEERSKNAMSSPTSRTRVVKGVSTGPTQLVNYKIRTTVEPDWDSIWYKDEGGRDKCMEVSIAIYDKDGQLKTGENIPLKPVLCYEVSGGAPESKVANQEILRTLGTANIVLDKDTGRTKLRFRVEDVSKNHQGQNFCLKVAPDTSTKRYRDIASAYTPAVNVRSKRNKRSRGGSNRQSTGKIENVGRSTDSPSATRQRLTGVFGAGAGAQDSVRPGGQGAALNPNNADALQQAMRGIIGWADVVVNELYPLQWQVLGYQQHEDGSGPDYSRPYHNMPNPNGAITRILSAYTDQVRGHLRVLLSAVEEAQANSTAAGGGVNAEFMSSTLPGRDFGSESYGSFIGNTRYGVQGGVAVPGETGIPQGVVGGIPGLHPTMASDSFRVRGETGSGMPYSARANMTNQAALAGMPGASAYGLHGHNPMSAAGMPHQPGLRGSHFDSQQRAMPTESRESEVQYVLAKQYKTLRCGTRLGFPSFSAEKEILGFFREGGGKTGVSKFVPISRHQEDFGPLEILQASEILEDFIAKESKAVHCLKDYPNLTSMLDACLLYDWTKDSSNSANTQSMRET